MDLSHFLILALATWRISSLLTSDNENGPFEILDYVRRYGLRVSRAFECLWCMSIWVGLVLTIALFYNPEYVIRFCLLFALSAVAVIVDRVIG